MPPSFNAIGLPNGCRAGAGSIAPSPVAVSLYGVTGYVLLLNGINLTSVSDTKGNTWVLLAQAGPLYLWGAEINNAFVAGDTVSVSASTISYNSQQLTNYLSVGGSYVDRVGGINGTMGGSTTQAFNLDLDTTRYSNELVGQYLGATVLAAETLATIRVQPNSAMSVTGCTDGTNKSNSRQEPTAFTPPGTTPADIDYAGTLQTGTLFSGVYTWGIIRISFIGIDSVNIETTGPGGEDPGSPTVLSRDRGTLGTLRQARVTPTTEQLLVDVYDDSFPEVVSVTNTIETSGVTACLIKVLKGQYPKKTHKGLRRTNTDIWYLSYLHSGSLKYRVSRDLGATWGVSTTIATGYHGFTQDFDMHPLRGLWVTALYDKTNTKWRITVGSLQDDGTWSFSSVIDLVTSAANAGFLKVRPDGIWEFTYRTTGGSIVTLRCRNLQADGTGTWV